MELCGREKDIGLNTEQNKKIFFLFFKKREFIAQKWRGQCQWIENYEEKTLKKIVGNSGQTNLTGLLLKAKQVVNQTLPGAWWRTMNPIRYRGWKILAKLTVKFLLQLDNAEMNTEAQNLGLS